MPPIIIQSAEATNQSRLDKSGPAFIHLFFISKWRNTFIQ